MRRIWLDILILLLLCVAAPLWLTLAYRDLQGRTSERRVRPLSLHFWGRVWTLGAWCELRQDFRAFRRYSEDAIIIFKKPIFEGIHLGDVKLVDGDWRLAGQSGYAVIVTGSALTVEDAQKQVYKRLENILIPNMFYRTDIGNRWTHDSDTLHSWGYLY